ncbi:unnamed protein product [Fraxinus pennsylvanica]|uniref:Uncharacterized protein n=1 Tax=Fraxinus pennsylvanica TaxID=56036 RepID=A0AAD1ZQK3_9LAMI|nr:unnamed protein product [Fraxinus pennsylvanica]
MRLNDRLEESLEELKRIAKRLQQESNSEEELKIKSVGGARDVRRLTKEDSKARITLALLGIILPLVVALDAEDPTSQTQIASLYALLNLAISNYALVPFTFFAYTFHLSSFSFCSFYLHYSLDEFFPTVFIAPFLILISLSDAIPFLVETLKDFKDEISSQAKQGALQALYNLSILPSYVLLMLETGLRPLLLSKLCD